MPQQARFSFAVPQSQQPKLCHATGCFSGSTSVLFSGGKAVGWEDAPGHRWDKSLFGPCRCAVCAGE